MLLMVHYYPENACEVSVQAEVSSIIIIYTMGDGQNRRFLPEWHLDTVRMYICVWRGRRDTPFIPKPES